MLPNHRVYKGVAKQRVNCCLEVFAAALRSNERGAAWHSTHGTEKIPLSLLLRNRRVYRFMWLNESCMM
jgi:hypothetical protein